jgi:hypothetical protein
MFAALDLLYSKTYLESVMCFPQRLSVTTLEPLGGGFGKGRVRLCVLYHELHHLHVPRNFRNTKA